MRLTLDKVFSKPEIVFVWVATIFGFLTITLFPILNAPDDNIHFQISYAIFSSNKKAGDDIVLNESIVLNAAKDHQYAHFFNKSTTAERDGFAVNVGVPVFDGRTKASAFDIMHLPQAIGVLMGRLVHPSLGVMVTTGRIINLLLYITCLYLIIKTVTRGKWVFVMLACTPILIQQAGSLSYDPINAVAIFAWMGFVINLYSSSNRSGMTKRELFTCVALLLFLILTKQSNVLLLTLLLAIPCKRLLSISIYKKIMTYAKQPVFKAAIILLFTCLALVAGYVLAKKLLAGHAFHPLQLATVLQNTFFIRNELIDATTIGVVGYFSNFYYHLSAWIVVIWFIALFVLMLSDKIFNVSKRLAVTSAIVFVATVLLITIGMYYAWAMTPERLGLAAAVADGIQGRYFTPLLIVIFPAIAYLQKVIVIKVKHSYAIPAFAMSICLFTLIVYMVQTVTFFWS